MEWDDIDALVIYLRWERERQGRTQREVAKAVGVGQSQISDWERGVNAPSIRSVRRWANELALDLVLVPLPLRKGKL